jgi:hypothetical protein
MPTSTSGILSPILGGFLGELEAVIPDPSGGDKAGASDGAVSVGDVSSAANNLPGNLTAL